MARQRKIARVPVHRSASKTAEVEYGATKGATFGVDLYDEDGNVITLEGLAALLSTTSILIQAGDEDDGDTLFNTIWNRIAEIPNDPYSVIGNPGATDILPVSIAAAANDRVLRRVADAVDFGFLTAGMFPDSMVTILSGTEFEIVTDQLNLHGQFYVDVQSLESPIVIDGDVGDATTPYLHFVNFGDQQDRRLLYVQETTADGFFIDMMLAETLGNNSIVIGSDYTNGLARAVEIWADGRVAFANDAFAFAASGDLVVTRTGTGQTLDWSLRSTGDVVLELRADTDNSGGENHNPYILFSQDAAAVVTRIGLTGDAGGDSIGASFTGALANTFAIHHPEPGGSISIGKQNTVSLLIDASGNVNIINSKDLLVGVVGANNMLYDESAATLFVRSAGDALLVLEADTDNVTETDNPTFRLLQDGQLVDARIGFSGATGVDSMGSTFTGGVANALTIHQINSSADAQIQIGVQNAISVLIDSANDFNVRAGNVFRIYDAANTDFGAWSHDGSNFNTAFTNTTRWVITGAAPMIQATEPRLLFDDSDEGSDNDNLWDMHVGSRTFSIRTRTTADGAGHDAIQISRDNASTTLAQVTLHTTHGGGACDWDVGGGIAQLFSSFAGEALVSSINLSSSAAASAGFFFEANGEGATLQQFHTSSGAGVTDGPSGGRIEFSIFSDFPYVFGTNFSERMRLGSASAHVRQPFYFAPGTAAAPGISFLTTISGASPAADANSGIYWIGADNFGFSTNGTSRGNVSSSRWTFTVPVRLQGYTVAALPAGTVGDTAYVTDANAPVFGNNVAGGGAATVPVFYNGANWIVG